MTSGMMARPTVGDGEKRWGRKIVLLLFTIVHFLSLVSYLHAGDVEPMAAWGSVNRGDEGRIGVFKGLSCPGVRKLTRS
jgi:hypothetical protein